MREMYLIGCMVLLVGAAQAEMHAFSLPDGRALEAEIMGYNAKVGLVELKRQDGKRVKVKPSVFVEDDQKYIKEWAASNAFLSERMLKVECDDQIVKKWKEEETQDVRYTDGSIEKNYIHNVIKYENVAYDFTFNNTTAIPIRDLVLEYCIYYEQSTMVWEDKPEAEQKTFCGHMDVPELREEAVVKLSTKPVMIYEDDINPVPQLNGDQRRPGKGKIIGVRARLKMKKGEAFREISKPSTLSKEKYPWATKSSSNKRKPYQRGRRK